MRKPIVSQALQRRSARSLLAADGTQGWFRCLVVTLGAAWLSALLFGPAYAQPAPDEPAAAQAERERIAAERSRIDAAYATEQRQCFKEFAVTDCRNASRRNRDAARTKLRKREIELNDAERARKGAVQRNAIEERQAERDRRAAEAAAAAGADALPPERARITPEPKPGARSERQRGSSAPLAPRGKPREDAGKQRDTTAGERADRIAQEAANLAQRERYLSEAAEHKADVLRKNAARQKPAAPLPVPSAETPQ